MFLFNTKLTDGLPVLVKEQELVSTIQTLTRPDEVFQFCRDALSLADYTEEYLYAISCNSKGKVQGCFEISHGTVNASLVTPREILLKLLYLGSVQFFLVHNHPSQDPSPSGEDLRVTKRVKEASDLIGIELLDHLILTQSGYVSLRDTNKDLFSR